MEILKGVVSVIFNCSFENFYATAFFKLLKNGSRTCTFDSSKSNPRCSAGKGGMTHPPDTRTPGLGTTSPGSVSSLGLCVLVSPGQPAVDRDPGAARPSRAVGSVLTLMVLAARTLGACLLVLVACVFLV